MAGKRTIIDERKRLSESLLWDLQKQAYGSLGPKAWHGGPVPHYITSNPFTAKQYAQVAFAFLRDLRRQGMFLEEQPLYFLELGAGIGRFAFQFLHAWKELTECQEESQIRIRYILSDNVASNLDYWKNHKCLQPFIEEGILELSLFDVVEDHGLTLWPSGDRVEPGEIANPLIAIANYLFDTIAQDRFRIHKGQLQEARVTLSVDREVVEDRLDPSLIDELQCEYSYEDLDGSTYYGGGSLLDQILAQYTDYFDEATFVLPVASFDCLQRIQSLGGGRLCFLAGDQGVAQVDQLRTWDDLNISKHGTFSHPVNYHAVGEFFNLQGGEACLSRDKGVDFVVVAGILGVPELTETRVAFETGINRFEPQDYWSLVNALELDVTRPSLSLVCRLLKLGNGDPSLLHGFYDPIREGVESASPEEKDRLSQLCALVADRFFPMSPQEGAFYLSIGMLCFQMKRFQIAASLFQRALLHLEDFAAAWFYLGLSQRFLGNLSDAEKSLARARDLDPQFALG